MIFDTIFVVKVGRDYFFVNQSLMDLFMKYDYKL